MQVEIEGQLSAGDICNLAWVQWDHLGRQHSIVKYQRETGERLAVTRDEIVFRNKKAAGRKFYDPIVLLTFVHAVLGARVRHPLQLVAISIRTEDGIHGTGGETKGRRSEGGGKFLYNPKPYLACIVFILCKGQYSIYLALTYILDA